MPVPKSYIDGVYQTLKANVPDFKRSPEEFSKLMSTDTTYRNGVYQALKTNIPEFTKTPDEFNGAISAPAPVDLSKNVADIRNQQNQLNADIEGQKKLRQSEQMAPGLIAVPDNKPFEEQTAKRQQDLQARTDETAKQIGVDPKDFTEIINAAPAISAPQDIKALATLKGENEPKYQRTIAATNWQNDLYGAIKLKDPQNADAIITDIHNSQLNPDADYNTVRQTTKHLVDLVHKYVDDTDEQDKIINHIKTDKANSYGGTVQGTEDVINADPRKQFGLNNNQILALQHEEDINPDQAAKYNKLLLDKGQLSDSERLGYEKTARELDQEGADLRLKNTVEQLNDLTAKKNKQGGMLTGEDATTFNNLMSNYNSLNDYKASLYNGSNPAYKNVNVMDKFTIAQDLVGQHSEDFNRWLLKTGAATGDEINGIKNLIATPFRSDEGNYKAQLGAIGSAQQDEAVTHLTPANQAENTYELHTTPEFQKEINRIKSDKSLSREQKIYEATKLQYDMPNGVYKQPINPKLNFSGRAILNSMGDMVAGLLPFMATEGVGNVAKAPKFINTLTSAVATGFQQNYAAAVQDGEANPYLTALRKTGVQAAFLAGVDAPGAIRKVFGESTAIGNSLKDLTDDEIAGLLTKKAPALKALGNTLKEASNTSLKLSAANTGASVTNSLISGDKIDPTELGKQFGMEYLKNTLLFGALGGAKGLISGEYKNAQDPDKLMLFNAVANPNETANMVHEQVTNGKLTPEQGTQILNNVADAKEIYDNTEFVNAKGEPLSDKDARNVLWNNVKKAQIEGTLKKILPKKVEENLNIELAKTEADNDLIHEPKTDKQLATEKASIEKQLAAKKDNGEPELNDKDRIEAKGRIAAIDERLAKPKIRVSADQAEEINKKQLAEKGIVPQPELSEKGAVDNTVPSLDYDKLDDNAKEKFIGENSNIIRSAFKTQKEYINYFEDKRNRIKEFVDKTDKEGALMASGITSNFMETLKKRGDIDKEYQDLLDEYSLNEKTAELPNTKEKGSITNEGTDKVSQEAATGESQNQSPINTEQNASTVRENQGGGSQGGQADESSQIGGGSNLQQAQAEQPKPAKIEQQEGSKVDAVTGIKNEVTKEERAERGLGEVEVEVRRSFGDVFEKAKKAVDDGTIDARKLASDLAQKPRALNAEESAALIYDRMKLYNEHSKVSDLLKEAYSSGDKAAQLEYSVRLAKIEDDINTNDLAARKTGYEQGLGLAARKMMIREDYTLANQIQQYKNANGGEDIPQEVRQKLEAMTIELEKANKKLEEYEQKIKQLKAERNIPKTGTKSKKSNSDFKKERDNIFDKIKEKWNNAGKDNTLTAVPVPYAKQLAAIAPDVMKLVKSYAEQGILKLSDIVDDIHGNLLKSIPEITKKDVIDILAGEHTEPKPKTIDPVRMKLQANVEKIKDQIDTEKYKIKQSKRNRLERGLDWFAKFRRAVILSSVTTVGKLAAAASYRQGTNFVEDVIGGGLSKIPGISNIAKGAPREGGLNIKAEAKSLSQWWQKATYQDVANIIKHGKGELDYLYGKKKDMPQSVLDFFGHIHGALKAPAKRAEFFRSFEKRAEYYAKQGEDISDPVVQSKIAAESYIDANRAIFMQDNIVSDAYRNAIKYLEGTGTKGKAFSTLLKVLMPIVKIPTNFVAETTSYAIGGVKAATSLVYHGLTNGFDNLTPDQKDYIIRNLKKQSLGAAMFAMGYFNPNMVGGYYTGKRKEGDLDAGDLTIGGVKMPHWMLHAPFLEVMQMGATFRRVQNDYSDKGKQGGNLAALGETGKGLMEETPMMQEMTGLTKATENESGLNKFLGGLATSIVVPPDIQKIARNNDTDAEGNPIKREAATVKDAFKAATPGLRETLPKAPVRTISKTDQTKPIWKFVTDKGADIPAVNLKQIKMQKDGKEVSLMEGLTEKQKDDFVAARQKKIEEKIKILMTNGAFLPGNKDATPSQYLTKQQIKDLMKTFATEATKDTKYELFGDDTEDTEKPILNEQ